MTRRKRNSRLSIGGVAMLVVFVGCFKMLNSSPAVENGEVDFIMKRAKREVVMRNGYRYFSPDTVNPLASTNWIFPVSEPDAVGSVDGYRNGIVLIKLGSGETTPEIRVIARNFSEIVASRDYFYTLSPNFSDNMIAYTKTRVVVMADMKNGGAHHVGIAASRNEDYLGINDYLSGIRFIDPRNNLFAVVKTVIEGGQSWWSNYLHIMKLEGRELRDLGRVMYLGQTVNIPTRLPARNEWVVHDGKIIAFERKFGGGFDSLDTRAMRCFDGTRETTHPFADIFNRNIKYFYGGSVRDFVIHPELPFGLVVGEHYRSQQHTLYLIRWDTDDPDRQFTPISHKLLPLAPLYNIESRAFAFTYPTISPDGKWFVMGFYKFNLHSSPNFIAIPIDRENRDFLDMDKVIVLGDIKPTFSGITWATSPTSLLVADGFGKLYKWTFEELQNAPVVAE